MGRWSDKVAMGLTHTSIQIRNEKNQALAAARKMGDIPAMDVLSPGWIKTQATSIRRAAQAIKKHWVHGTSPAGELGVALTHLKHIRRGYARMNVKELAKWLAAAEQAINAANKKVIAYASANRSAKATLYTADHMKGSTADVRAFWYKTFAVASTVCGHETAAKIATAACRGRGKKPHKDGRSAPRAVPKGKKSRWTKVYNAALSRTRDQAKARRIADGVAGKVIRSKAIYNQMRKGVHG